MFEEKKENEGLLASKPEDETDVCEICQTSISIENLKKEKMTDEKLNEKYSTNESNFSSEAVNESCERDNTVEKIDCSSVILESKLKSETAHKKDGIWKKVLAISLAVSISVSLIFSLALTTYLQKKNTLITLPQNLVFKNNTDSANKNEMSTISATKDKELTPREISVLASPAVVAIYTEAEFVDFFGQRGKREGAGSGVIIRPDGYIVTNNHVVANAQKLMVSLNDGKSYEAELIGRDQDSDLAVIKIKREETFPYLQLADSSTAKVGDRVVAIGNPLGEFEGSLTVGYISALERTVVAQNDDNSVTTLYGLLQTDAAINRGNSGGALINTKGELLGVNTVKTSSLGVEGLGFAIPSNIIKPIVEDLIKYGEIKNRPVIGISGRNISSDIQNAYGLPAGVWVVAVSKNSPADKAGIKAHDIIVSFNGKKISSIQEINAMKLSMKAGDPVSLELIRNGEKISVDLILSGAENTVE